MEVFAADPGTDKMLNIPQLSVQRLECSPVFPGLHFQQAQLKQRPGGSGIAYCIIGFPFLSGGFSEELALQGPSPRPDSQTRIRFACDQRETGGSSTPPPPAVLSGQLTLNPLVHFTPLHSTTVHFLLLLLLLLTLNPLVHFTPLHSTTVHFLNFLLILLLLLLNHIIIRPL
ncbi:hypothetical protein Pmani_035776 [Petrolisthes manimaculis]|uniref:Uncharacterized protein n=1 Tax=Petrolisthes manimaculis TaxID=1843537 RepID=A0AAE1NL31_9EUCA|nr:hypothetical protein Pmani_035776 [Petrolisthes manimaculis]